MRNASNRWHRGKIERVPRMLRECTHTAFAEDHVVIAFSHYVLRCEQPFFERCSHSALQQHGQPGSTRALQKRKILHVASPDLNHVAVLLDEVDMRFLDGFSHNLQTELLANGCHNFPAFFAEALERVRRRSRFPNTSTKKTRTTLLHSFRDGEGLFATLDRARTRDNRELAVANRRVADANHSLVRSQIECDQFVRLSDADDFRDTDKIFETPAIDRSFIAGDADRRPRGSRHGMRAEADCLNNVYHRIDFRCRGAGFHYN